MNFKSWLLISEEEEKDINLSNTNLTATIPPLNTIVSNPKLTTTIPPLNASVSNPNLTTTKISNRELASNQKVKELAIEYINAKGFAKLPPEFKSFLNGKKMAYRDYKKADGTKTTTKIWYPSDIEVARENGLPEGWMLITDFEKESNDKLKELAIYYGRNGSVPSTNESDEKNKSLATWLYNKKNGTITTYKSDDIIWAQIVALSKNWDKKEFPYELPDNWRDVKKNAWQKYLQKKQINSSKNLEKLAIYFGRNNAAPSTVDSNQENKSLGVWLSVKKIRPPNPDKKYDETWAEIVSKFPNWIDPVTKKPFLYTNLPIDWRKLKPNVKHEEGRKNNNKRLEDLAYYFGRNGSEPSTTNKSLANWLYKNKNSNPYEASDNETWAELVARSKTSGWIDPDTKEPFKYSPLPEDWRKVKSTQEKGRKISNSKRLEELAYYYGINGSGPSTSESNQENKSLADWLRNKKNKTTYRTNGKSDKTWANMVELSKTWDKEKLPHALPENWRTIIPNVKQEKGRINSSKRLEELAYYYGRNKSAPSTSGLGRWHVRKKNETTNTHEASDNETWAELVARSKTSGWIDPDTKEPFKYSPLPDNWRDIEPLGIKSLGEEYVTNILTELGIKNDPQHRDVACFNKRCLPFDFSITHNGKKYFVEYHGKQHYIPAYFGSGEDMTDQEKANNALNAFKYTRKNDKIKYEHCEKGHLPFLVIPYWLDKNSDIIKNTIIEFLKTNQFNETFANPVVPQKNKEYHDRMLKRTKCFASGKILNCKELFKKQKTTFEQFLINKNFINI